MKILITGASGFIGSFIVEEALRQGFETWAAVRRSSSRAFLQDSRIHFIELDLSSEEKLTEALLPHRFDYVVHAAGATKCNDPQDFFRINTDGTRHLVNALLRLGMPVRKFVYLSSLSVFGAIREEEPHQEIALTDEPRPNSAYGKSKIAAEEFLSTVKDRLNYVVLRPTGVYGPRERDYLVMMQSIQQHVDVAVGYKLQEITFVYVTDVVQAVFLTLDKPESGKAYFLTDGEKYESSTFSDYVHDSLGRPWWIRLTLPIWVLRIACNVCDAWSKVSGKRGPLNNDKFHILAQRNWLCDVQTTIDELGYEPKVTLREGVRRAVEWYKKEGWL